MTMAQPLAWSDQLATGLDEVDNEHRRLIDIISMLCKHCEQGATVEKIRPILAELHNYTAYHFKNEADLMNAWPVNQANKVVHLKEHWNFIERIKKAEELVAIHAAAALDHLLAFLVKWLVHHITGVDARMAREIIALRSGDGAGISGIAENALHDALIDTVSELYDSLGARTLEMLELNRQLQVYHDQQEEENALAQDIILRLMQRGELSSSRLHYWLSPAAVFSGDILAAARGPKGQIYAILADATGHGLAAAITALPVLTVFHAMAGRGRPLIEILVEINRHLRATLPVGRFVAATLLCVDVGEHSAEAWIGGMPGLLLLSHDGRLVQRITSSQMPLGIVDFNSSMSAITRISWDADSQFAMYSDGLSEAANLAGEQFGDERIVAAILSAPAERRVAAVQEALTSHVGSVEPHDDISLMLIDCREA